jgi:hypothetical protein
MELEKLVIIGQLLSVFKGTKLQIVAFILLQICRLHFFSVYPHPSEHQLASK